LQEEVIRQALEQYRPTATGTQEADDLSDNLSALARKALLARPGQGLLTRFTETAERQLILQALAQAQYNQTQAARLLGIPRPTLKSKMDKYEIEINPAGI